MMEKRSSKRCDSDLSGHFRILEISEEFFATTVINITAKGICFQSGTEIEEGKEIEINIEIEEDRPVLIKGLAAWSSKIDDSGFCRVGVKLIRAGLEDEQRFINFFSQKFSFSPVKRKILVIDDEKDLVELVAARFNDAGYETVLAFDGEEGYQQYLDEKPDLIVLDLKMPKLNGFEVCRKIRRESKDASVPIIMLTALKEDVDRLIGKVVGAQKYMTKPFDMDELLKEVAWLMPIDISF